MAPLVVRLTSALVLLNNPAATPAPASLPAFQHADQVLDVLSRVDLPGGDESTVRSRLGGRSAIRPTNWPVALSETFDGG